MTERVRPRQARCVDAGVFMLRTPLLPMDVLERWTSESPEAGISVLDGVADGCGVDEPTLRARLRDYVTSPLVLHAIYIATPTLYRAIDLWLRDPLSKKAQRTEDALVRYLMRMATRCTPFGLFAGCSVGATDSSNAAQTTLSLGATASYRPVSRLDFEYLDRLCSTIASDSRLIDQLTYRPNPTLVKMGDAWHLLKYTRGLHAGAGSRSTLRIDSDEFIDAIIAAAADGATVPTLVDCLLTRGHGLLDSADARQYILSTIEAGVLVRMLEPPVTGKNPIGRLTRDFEDLGLKGVSRALEHIENRLRTIDADGVGQPATVYDGLLAELNTIASVDVDNLIQVDLFKPAVATLGGAVLREIQSAVEVLFQIREWRDIVELDDFRQRFVDRYERQWMPLLEVLDEDAGIGFGVGQKSVRQPRSYDAGQLTPFEQLLAEKLADGGREIVLDAAELPQAVAPLTAPPTFDVVATILASSCEDIARGDFTILLKGLDAPPAGKMLSRFCHVDAEIERAVRSLVDCDERVDGSAVHAEVIHLPNSKVGNVTIRPTLRRCEIECFARSGAPAECIVPLSDLYVSVADDGTVLLYSRKLRSRIIPRLTHAHNFSYPSYLPAYRLLGHLQLPGYQIPNFNWGKLECLPFTPRVRIGSTIFAPARWRLYKHDIKKLTNDGDGVREMQHLRRRKSLPRWIMFREGDNLLPVDLDNRLSVRAFVGALKGKEHALLEEQCGGLSEACASGPEGKFAHEIIVPFKSAASTNTSSDAVASSVAAAHLVVAPECRTATPGSEWLYVKLYATFAALEQCLTSDIGGTIKQLSRSNPGAGWFFVRYDDGHTHFRLRLRIKDEQRRQEAFRQLMTQCESELRRKNIWKVQIDTYEREIERYGGVRSMAVVEDIFCADSAAIADMAPDLRACDSNARFVAMLLSVDRLLSDYDRDHERKAAFASALCQRSAVWRKRDKTTIKRLSSLERENKAAFSAFDATRCYWDESTARMANVLTERSSFTAIYFSQLRDLADRGELCRPVEDILASIVHMNVNRMCAAPDSFLELAVYDILRRLYSRNASCYTAAGCA